MGVVKVVSLNTGRWRYVDERTATHYFRNGRYIIGSPVGDPLAERGRQFAGLYPSAQKYTSAAQVPWNATPMSLTGGSAADVTVIDGKNIRSDNPTIPALLLDNYQGLVIVKRCNLFGYGESATAKGIVGSTFNARIQFEDCNFFSGNPMVLDKFAGRSAVLGGFRSFSAVNCSHYGTRGFYLTDWVGGPGQTEPTVQLLRNYFRNIDGRRSNPADALGWRRGNVSGVDHDPAQMIQLNGCKGIHAVLVADNEVMNEAGLSHAEDIYSGFLTYGTAASPITIDRNLFSGQSVYDAWFDPALSEYYGNNMPDGTAGKVDARGYQNSGGGGLLGDGKGATYLLDPAFMRFVRNTVLGMNNYGLGVASGHDHTIDGNVILRSGYVRHLARNVKIGWKHVPLQLQDYYTGGGASIDDGTGTATSRVRWYNVDVTNNQYGYTSFDPRSAGAVVNDPLLINSPVRTNTGNVQTLNVTRAMEDTAELNHRQVWATAAVVVGNRI